MRAHLFLAAAAAAAALAFAAPARAGGDGPLPFISDDYARALAQARARNVPIVVDVWAPW
jgi:hypothetical protein